MLPPPSDKAKNFAILQFYNNVCMHFRDNGRGASGIEQKEIVQLQNFTIKVYLAS